MTKWQGNKGPAVRTPRWKLSFSRLGSFSCFVACLIYLVASCYAAWRLGGTESIVQWQLAIAIGISLAFGLVMRESRASLNSGQIAMSIVVVLWIGLGAIQLLNLPSEIAQVITAGRMRIASDFGQSSTQPQATIALAESQHTWSLHVLGAVCFLGGLIVFRGTAAKILLLTVIGGNAALIAAWAVIQRCTNTQSVLPGSETEMLRFAFSTFRYRNAGASYLLLGFAALLGLLVWLLHSKNLWKFSSAKHAKAKLSNTEGYRSSGSWSDLPVVASITMLLLVVIAILLSLSRGAWAALVIGFVVIILASLRHLGIKVITALAAIASVTILGAIIAGEQMDRIALRAERLSVDSITADDRFIHWQGGLATALHFFPSGSGIGTYGFSQLPFQNRDTRGWYSHAHNQYLEVLTECGFLGLLLVVIAVGLIFTHFAKLLTKEKDPIFTGLGAAGLIGLISIVVQATVDFTIVYPANMLTAALLLGCACGTASNERLAKRPVVNTRWYANSFTWMLVMAPPLLLSQHFLGKQVRIERVLARTEIPAEDKVPSLKQCEDNRTRLRTLAELYPEQASLWQRLAWWELADLRLQRIGRPTQTSMSKRWTQESPMNWFAHFHQATPDERPSLRKQFLSDSQHERSLRLAYSYYKKSVEANPLVAQTHFGLAQLAPWLGEDWRPHAERSRRLSGSNPEHLYANGLLCIAAGEKNQALSLWHRCLAVGTPRRDAILKIALGNWESRIIIEELFPPVPSQLLSMTGRALTDPELLGTKAAWHKRCKEVILAADVSEAERQLDLARLAEIGSDWSSAIHHLEQLVRLEPKDPAHRIRLANNLLQVGDYLSASDQAMMARSLKGSKLDLERLLNKITTVQARAETKKGS